MKQPVRFFPTAMMLLGVVVWTGAASAAVIASDNFESYNIGALIPQGGGTGWSTNWSSNSALTGTTANNYLVTSPGSPYTDGQRGEVQSTAAAATPYRGLSTPLADVAGNTYYISYDSQNTNGGTRFFGLALLSGTTEQMLIGQGSGSSNWTINNVDIGGGVRGTINSGIATTNVSHLLVKIVMGGAGTPETVSFWINPDVSLTVGNPVNVAAQIVDSVALYAAAGGTNMTGFLGNIDRIRIGSGATSSPNTLATHWMDNLLITTDSPFAIPEPASLALIALSVPFFVRRRK